MKESQQGGLEREKRKLMIAIAALIMVLMVFVAAKIMTELRAYKFIGLDIVPQTTISVSGEGEAYGKPDIAEVSFAVVHESLVVADAQGKVDEAMKKIDAYLKDSGVEGKDIKTTTYNVYPRYEYVPVKGERACTPTYCPPTPNERVLRGYEVTQSVSVKIRNIDDAGKVLGGLGELGATSISGLNFMIDDEDALKREARQEAIVKAKAKAKELSSDLGVELVRIVNFSESGSYPARQYYDLAEAVMLKDADGGVVPEISVGENKITSNITITYEIR